MTATAEKPNAPSCERNRDAILDVLRQCFHGKRRVLEIGSGTGQHAVYFADAMPDLTWQASDLAGNLPGIERWIGEAKLSNLPAPLELDVSGNWPARRFDAVFTANTLHIMSWSEVESLFRSLSGVLEQQAVIAIYGPFNYQGQFTSESNAKFNGWLQERGPHMAIRDFEQVNALADAIGLTLLEDREMPANNRLLVWRQTS